ncbi:hypothetical protein MELLADRAFT_94716 [Melampsora larici-populina 98AG31]|uniref:Uncharacterized protein n=1 Tax=Melampsora larici-populina (strain 98AG31 / pathotype 3-4-7) TaxID=747676 RepID=F4S7Q0_MELLP|nr:hypothetical protein MELLADRAFT_94716 [Melampsora larici-populina 98AG31]
MVCHFSFRGLSFRRQPLKSLDLLHAYWARGSIKKSSLCPTFTRITESKALNRLFITTSSPLSDVLMMYGGNEDITLLSKHTVASNTLFSVPFHPKVSALYRIPTMMFCPQMLHSDYPADSNIAPRRAFLCQENLRRWSPRGRTHEVMRSIYNPLIDVLVMYGGNEDITLWSKHAFLARVVFQQSRPVREHWPIFSALYLHACTFQGPKRNLSFLKLLKCNWGKLWATMHLWVWVNSCQTTFTETDSATYKKCPGRTTRRYCTACDKTQFKANLYEGVLITISVLDTLWMQELPTQKSPTLLFIVTTSPCQDWVICAPAAILRFEGRFSGPLSGIEPLFPVTRHHHGRPLSYHRKLIGQIFE